MTPKKQRIALAKFMGFRFQKRLKYDPNRADRDYAGSGVYTPTGRIACFYDARGNGYQNLDWDTCFQRRLIPDYLNDYNEIFSVLKRLFITGIKRGGKALDLHETEDVYLGYLLRTCKCPRPELHARPEQMAEAILRTLNLYM